MFISLLLALQSLTTPIGPTDSPPESTFYLVKLIPNFEKQELHGDEVIAFDNPTDVVELKKQSGLKIKGAPTAGDTETGPTETHTLRIHLDKPGKQALHFEYTASAGRGMQWFTDGAGFVTAFYCDTWMI